MIDAIASINDDLEEIATEIVMMDSDDITTLGIIINRFSNMHDSCRKVGHPSLTNLVKALEGYTEKMILRQTDDLNPLEEGIVSLQSICQSLYNETDFKKDLSPLFDKLGFKPPVTELVSTQAENAAQISMENTDTGETQRKTDEEPDEPPGPHVKDLDDDEKEIIEDFVTESLDGLAGIEVTLMDLEQNPEDLDAINSIFRPFHTIKGISAFINLARINKLAHSAENLLDKARSEDIKINQKVIDIILETVDMLKKLIEGVNAGLEAGGALDIGTDVGPLKARIDNIVSNSDNAGSRLGEIMLAAGTITEETIEKALEIQKEKPEKKLGEILVKELETKPKEVISALRVQTKTSKKRVDLQVKVDTKKLDNLVNLIGELAIVQSMLKQNKVIIDANNQELYQNLGQLGQISSGLQTAAMSMRMVPIKSTFQKMVRLVRDVAKGNGKEVNLYMSGEDTEIDRNVVDELYEPMVHMIRNAVDHGIETPGNREAVGKQRKGNVNLNAYHKGGNIIVEIKDDGCGLDKGRIREKAIANNLITENDNLTDFEICNLIFEPGFSTAEKVTDISGRGVGMDVVKKGIERLRGRVEISSIPGKGSTFSIRIPLTLAIIDGMVVRISNERYIIPVLAIKKSFRPEKKDYSKLEGKGEMILTHGRLAPLARLDRLFEIRNESANPWEAIVVAVEYEEKQICILVDELLGKEDIVIKSMGESMKNVKGIAGGTILGDGKVGLILDMAGIFELVAGR